MRGALSALLVLASGMALAHDGEFHAAGPWTTDLLVKVPLAISGVAYAVGVCRLWRLAGIGRGVRGWQAACFASGWLLLSAALLSPLHRLGERLFTAHMVEHEILMVLAAPLLVIARPVGGMLWSLPAAWRPAVGGFGRSRALALARGWLTGPAVATSLHGIAIWVWHVPVLYEAALAHPLVHWLQHLSFFATALLFWWSLLHGRARHRGYGAAVFYLFVTAIHSGFLGILLAIARAPVYPSQASEAPRWGLTPLEDQQLAGLVMWVPAGMIYAAAALALAGLWISRSRPSAPKGGLHAVSR
jgi:cytochrome c oxidase assembly factor CtaG